MSALIILGAIAAIVILAALAALAFVIDNRVEQALAAYDRRTQALENQASAISGGAQFLAGAGHGIGAAIYNSASLEANR